MSALTESLAGNSSLKLFAFLDTASDNKMILDLRDQDPDADYELLFDNLLDAEPSPIVVELSLASPFLVGLIAREQEKHDADFSLFLSVIPLKDQLTHWQNRLMVRDLDARHVLFRYFDPRVWFSFLEVSLLHERNTSLGPARDLWLHAKNDTWIGFQNTTEQKWDKAGHPMLPVATPLALRPPHKDAAESLAELNFSIRLRDYFRDEIPEELENFSPNILQRMILAGIHRAKQNGFMTEDTITAWVQIMFQISPNFDEQTSIRKALQQCPKSCEDKLDFVLENTTEQDWDEAEDLYDNNAWVLS